MYLAALFLLHMFILVTVRVPYKSSPFLAPHRTIQTSAVGPKMKVITKASRFSGMGKKSAGQGKGKPPPAAGWVEWEERLPWKTGQL